MRLPRPLYRSTRLMAAADVGEGVGTLHVAPVRRDSEDRVVWRYVIEDGEHREVARGEDLQSGSGDDADPVKAIETLVAFLSAAAEACQASMNGRASENGDLFPEPVMEWAYVNEDDLASVALELAERNAKAAEPDHSTGAGGDAVWRNVWSETGCADCAEAAVDGRPWGPDHCWATHRPHVPRQPYLRPAGRQTPLPAGWIAEPVGQWNGQQVEVVYHPRRYDVRVVPSAETEDREGDLAADGWAYQGTDGYTVMWIRDRVAATRAALDRTPPDPPELGGPGR